MPVATPLPSNERASVADRKLDWQTVVLTNGGQNSLLCKYCKSVCPYEHISRPSWEKDQPLEERGPGIEAG